MKQLYAYSNTKKKFSYYYLFDNIPFAFSCKYDCAFPPLQFICKWHYCISPVKISDRRLVLLHCADDTIFMSYIQICLHRLLGLAHYCHGNSPEINYCKKYIKSCGL